MDIEKVVVLGVGVVIINLQKVVESRRHNCEPTANRHGNKAAARQQRTARDTHCPALVVGHDTMCHKGSPLFGPVGLVSFGAPEKLLMSP